MILVKRISPFTGKENEMVLDITQAQVTEWNLPAKERRLVQDIFPNLNDNEREFIMTGYTAQDWKTIHNIAIHGD